MSTSKLTKDDAPRVLVPITTGTEEIEAVVLIDCLRRAGITVDVVGVHKNDDDDDDDDEDKHHSKEWTCSRGVKIIHDFSLETYLKENIAQVACAIPGGKGASDLGKSKLLIDLLKSNINNENFTIAAICAAPSVVLHENGLLENVPQATCFPTMAESLKEKYVDQRVVVSKSGKHGATVITSKGPGTSFEFAFAIIQHLLGKEAAHITAKPMHLSFAV